MNHLLNKDWGYVLHIYEEEMKGSTGWGRGEEHAELMVSQTYCITPGAAQPPVQRGPSRAAGGSGRAASHFVCMGGFFDAFLKNGCTTNVLA